MSSERHVAQCERTPRQKKDGNHKPPRRGIADTFALTSRLIVSPTTAETCKQLLEGISLVRDPLAKHGNAAAVQAANTEG